MARPRAELDTQNKTGGGKRARKRISVYLQDDGTPDWDSVPPEQQAALGRGPTVDAEEPSPEELAQTEQAVAFLLHMAVQVETVIVAARMDLPRPLVSQVLTPPDGYAEKMRETGARLLQRYAGGMMRWADELAMAGMIVTWQMGALANLQALKAAQTPPPADQPAPKPAPEEVTVPFPDPLEDGGL